METKKYDINSYTVLLIFTRNSVVNYVNFFIKIKAVKPRPN